MIIMKRIKEFCINIFSRITGHYYIQIELPKELLGGEKYGGWNICPNGITKDSIVYSFGVARDASFDLAIIEKYGVKVFAFDPTPFSINWVKSQKLPIEFNFYGYGIANYDGTIKFYPPDPEHPKDGSHTILYKKETANKAIEVEVHKLRTIMNMLGHNKIDILKMDIEGSEYSVIDDIISSGIDIKQILVEFHTIFKGAGIFKTKRAINSLNKAGFKIFDASPNEAEYSFIRV